MLKLKKLMGRKGFTLVELLIVIAVIGILAVAVLAALNPIEQMRKARDSGRLSDARELIGAIQRYQVSHRCHAWQNQAASNDCLQVSKHPASVRLTSANFQTAWDAVAANTAWLMDLITTGELKTQFQNKASFVSPGFIYLTEVAANSVINVCFEPESNAARTGGAYGPTWGNEDGTGTATCTGTYANGAPTGTCWVCVQ